MFAGKAGFNSVNVVMKQEINKALNDITNTVVSDCEKMEHLN